MRRLMKTVALAMVMAGAVAARAQAIPLTTLAATNGTILVGNELFSNFSVAPFVVAIGNVTPVSYSGIDVQGITIAGEHGLRFTGPFSATFQPNGSPAFAFYDVTFDVTTTDPSAPLHDVRHAYTVTHSGSGGQIRLARAMTEVTDDFIDDVAVVGPSTTIRPIQVNPPLPSPTVLNQNVVLPHDVALLHVAQHIFIQAGSLDEIAMQAVAFPFIDVTFSQTTVPEPATLVLLGIGLGVIGRALRRRAARR